MVKNILKIPSKPFWVVSIKKIFNFLSTSILMSVCVLMTFWWFYVSTRSYFSRSWSSVDFTVCFELINRCFTNPPYQKRLDLKFISFNNLIIKSLIIIVLTHQTFTSFHKSKFFQFTFRHQALDMAIRAKVFLYANAFKGTVKLTDFQLVEQELPPLRDGQFLAEAIYLSVDPYMRSYVLGSPVGTTMIGRQVAK